MIEKFVSGMFFTNSYVISNNNECVIVDPGQNYQKIAETIKQKYDVKAILITHGHIDHIDGARYFDCPIFIHEKEKDVFLSHDLSLYSMVGQANPYINKNIELVTVKDLEKVNLIGYEFMVLHTPGHTKGSVCYSFLDNVFTGDCLFKGTCGRTDFPTGDVVSMNKSLKRIVSTFPLNYNVYPGHEDKTTIEHEKNTNQFIR